MGVQGGGRGWKVAEGGGSWEKLAGVDEEDRPSNKVLEGDRVGDE